jgi:hypothetical protein
MRFRLGTGVTAGGGEGGGLAGGISRAISGFAMLPVMQAQAAEQGEQAAAKSALMASQQKLADAHAALFGAQADGERQQQARGTTDALLDSAALQNGVPLHLLGEYATYAKTGQLPGQYVQPPEDLGGGPALPAPGYADPGLSRRISQTLGLTQNALAMGDKDVAHVADAAGKYQKQGAIDAMAAHPGLVAAYGPAFAASEGKKVIDNIGESGAGYNVFTGQGQTLDPGMYALFGDKGKAEIRQKNAAAGASNASAAKYRAETEQIVNGPKGVLVQTEAGPVFADPRSGRSVPVLNADGTPALPAKKDKALPASAAKGLLENQDTLRRAETALALAEGKTVGGIQGDAEATGLKGYLPNGLLNRTDAGGVDTRAALADLSSMLVHDRSGAAVSASEFPRLRPFVPLATDDPETVRKKLAMFVNNYRAIVDDQVDFYKQSGYGVPNETLRKADVKPAAGASGKQPFQLSAKDAELQYNNLPSGAEFIAPDGSRRRKP